MNTGRDMRADTKPVWWALLASPGIKAAVIQDRAASNDARIPFCTKHMIY